MSALFLADPIAKQHDTGPGHPEQIARWDAAVQGLAAHRVTTPKPRAATDDELALCHAPAYIRIAKHDVESGRPSLSTGDTDINRHSFEAATRATGLCLTAVDEVFAKRTARAFCVVRPPGHHAGPARGMGFCLFNTIAVAARYAQKKHGAARVLIADWDVHHGNGTQDIFYRDPSVFFFSTHQSPWYPGTGDADERGDGPGEGTTLNCPFPAGAGKGEIVPAFTQLLAPAMDRFKPDLVLISAGFDSRAGDPLGHFRLTDEDFTELTNRMRDLAEKHAGGRLISVLEGGYNLTGLTKAVTAHAAALNA
jgi:acetoin utilization deacetylase AcuC-like enzyme